MKTFKSLAPAFLVLMLSGCVVNIQDSITGNGNVVKQKRDVPEFTGIKVGSGIDVLLTQGDTPNLEVEADENLQDWIRTEVNGSVLHIFTDKSIRFAKSKKVYATCKTLDKIDISSAGDITGETPFITEKLDIDMSSAGDLHLEVMADEIGISISSAGNANLKGKTNILKADLSSAGDLNAFDLEAKKGDINVSSAGKAKVFVTEEASFRSSSAGDIDYKGEPRIREIHTSSAGSVNKK
jgi:Putative auto-transporter adhesin, head GIN domain